MSFRLMMTFWSVGLLVLCPLVGAQAHTRTHRHSHRLKTQVPKTKPYSWEGIGTDLSPILIQPYQVTPETQNSDTRRMNLEDGLDVKSTHWIAPSDVRSRDLFILEITQSLEGGFDSVNLYDKGLLSWGIMQWSARSGSLGQALVFVKRRLWAAGRKSLWDKTFVANGLDVDTGGLIVYGKPARTPAQMRVAFRGTMKVGKYDPKLTAHWALTMARAGRQPAVAALQVDYAAHVVDAALNKRLAGLPYHAPGRDGVTVTDLAGSDPYAEALVFALWTNNPRHAFEYVQEAAQDTHAVSLGMNPALWPPGAFSAALLQRCRQSRFGNWPRRAALIEARAALVASASPAQLTPFEAAYQSVLTVRKVRRAFEVADRRSSRGRLSKSLSRVTNVTHPEPKTGYTGDVLPRHVEKTGKNSSPVPPSDMD